MKVNQAQNTKWHLLLAIGIGLVSAECRCQHSCHIDYGNENQIDYNLRPRVGVSGSITLPNSPPVPHVCLAVFTDDTHQFVLGRTSDSKGQFDLPLLPNKTYRLVVRVSPFGVANARLRIVHTDRKNMIGKPIDAAKFRRSSSLRQKASKKRPPA